MLPTPQQARGMILANGDPALGGGERGCLLCGDGCRAGGNFGPRDCGGGLAAGCAVSSLPKDGAAADADEVVVALGPDKVGVGEAVRVGVAVQDV